MKKTLTTKWVLRTSNQLGTNTKNYASKCMTENMKMYNRLIYTKQTISINIYKHTHITEGPSPKICG